MRLCKLWKRILRSENFFINVGAANPKPSMVRSSTLRCILGSSRANLSGEKYKSDKLNISAIFHNKNACQSLSVVLHKPIVYFYIGALHVFTINLMLISSQVGGHL